MEEGPDTAQSAATNSRWCACAYVKGYREHIVTPALS